MLIFKSSCLRSVPIPFQLSDPYQASDREAFKFITKTNIQIVLTLKKSYCEVQKEIVKSINNEGDIFVYKFVDTRVTS